MYYSENGDELKKFNTRDGMGFALLKKQGILTGIITSENVELNRRRAGKLNLDFLEQGCIDKITAVTRICEECGIDLRNVAYVGDDMNDLDLIKSVGFGCCPSDAVEQIKDVAKYVTNKRWGRSNQRDR